MMENLGYLLYPIMVAILVWMWLRVRGMQLEEIVAHSADEHHTVNDIFKRHPHGGDWKEFTRWVDDHRH